MDGFDLSGGREHFGGYSYTASAYVLSPGNLGDLTERLHEDLVATPGAFASASAPSSDLCIVRVLTHDAITLYRLLEAIRTLARRYLGLPAPARTVL